MTQQEKDFTDLLTDLEEAKKDNREDVIYDINQKLYYLLSEIEDKSLIEDAAQKCSFGIDVADIVRKAKEYALKEVGSEDAENFNEIYVKRFRDKCHEQANYWSELKVCDPKYYQNFDSEVKRLLYEDYFSEEMDKEKYEVKQLAVPISNLYYNVGYGFIDIDEPRIALVFLQMAVDHNFSSARIRYELSECYKQMKHWDEYLNENLYAWAFSTTAEEVARYFRNMAFYYSEMGEWQYAYINITISSYYENNEDKINAEIDFIKEYADVEIDENVTDEMIEAYHKDTDNPVGPRPAVKEALYHIANQYLDNGEKYEALTNFSHLYNLTGNEKIWEIVKRLLNEVNN